MGVGGARRQRRIVRAWSAEGTGKEDGPGCEGRRQRWAPVPDGAWRGRWISAARRVGRSRAAGVVGSGVGRLLRSGRRLSSYDRPADALVANFGGGANLRDATVVGAETVDTPIGRLATPRHGRATGSTIRLLVRPERIEVADAGAGENVFAANVLRDRFFGASRQIEVAAGNGRLEIETAARGRVDRVRVPRDAIQFINDN